MKYQDYKGLNKISPRELSVRVADDQSLKLYIVENMKQYGGSFVKALAECLLLADRDNRLKLCEAFFLYILAYLPEKWKRKEE